jgi:hypothetical protein
MVKLEAFWIATLSFLLLPWRIFPQRELVCGLKVLQLVCLPQLRNRWKEQIGFSGVFIAVRYSLVLGLCGFRLVSVNCTHPSSPSVSRHCRPAP